MCCLMCFFGKIWDRKNPEWTLSCWSSYFRGGWKKTHSPFPSIGVSFWSPTEKAIVPIAGPPRSVRYWTAVVVVVVVVVGGGVLLLVVVLVLVLVLALVLGLVVLRSILVSSIVVFFASRMSLERKGESQRKLQKQTKGTKTVKILKLCWKKRTQPKETTNKTNQTWEKHHKLETN